jgi:hypothetical protein
LGRCQGILAFKTSSAAPHLHHCAATPIHHLQSLPHLQCDTLSEANRHRTTDSQLKFPFVVAVEHPVVGEGLDAGVFTGGEGAEFAGFYAPELGGEIGVSGKCSFHPPPKPIGYNHLPFLQMVSRLHRNGAVVQMVFIGELTYFGGIVVGEHVFAV